MAPMPATTDRQPIAARTAAAPLRRTTKPT
jgi:hypothetical protein